MPIPTGAVPADGTVSYARRSGKEVVQRRRQARPTTAESAVLELQRSAGNAAVVSHLSDLARPGGSPPPGPVGAFGPLTLQGIWLDAYVDNDPLHDPSRLTDAQIQATQDYVDFSTFTFPPLLGPLATGPEALLACRLLLRNLREGGSRTPYSADYLARLYIGRAKEQLGTLAAAAQQVGHLNWVPFSTGAAVMDPSKLPTEFGRWILAGGPEPSALTGSVNCWEMVLLGAFRAGYLSKARITQIYTRAVDAVRAGRATLVGTTVEAELRAGAGENVYDPGNPDTPRPLAGDLVIFQTAAGHVAISQGSQSSTGQHQVLSLWSMPGNNFQVQQTTIEALLAAGASRPVKFWSPTW